MLRKYEQYIGSTADAAVKTRFYSQLAINITRLIHFAVMILVVVSGVYEVEAKDLTLGGLIATVILSGRALAPLSQISALLNRYHLTKVSFSALNSLMQLPVERPQKHRFLHRANCSGGIEFDDVCVVYA